jgi:hypothetical protein
LFVHVGGFQESALCMAVFAVVAVPVLTVVIVVVLLLAVLLLVVLVAFQGCYIEANECTP